MYFEQLTLICFWVQSHFPTSSTYHIYIPYRYRYISIDIDILYGCFECVYVYLVPTEIKHFGTEVMDGCESPSR